MIGVIRAEFAKVITTRFWWILLIILIGYVAFTAAILAAAFGGSLPGSASNASQLPSDQLPPLIYSVASTIGYVFPLILGTLAVTGEFRHQTLTPTFLATPRRGQVMIAKLLTMASFGALYGVAALIGSVAPGAAILAMGDNGTGLGDEEIWLMFARTILAMALWAVIGVAVGTVIPNQVAAIVVVIAFTQFVEPILRTIAAFVEWAAELGKFLPGAAGDALVGASIFSALGMSSGPSGMLEWWQGGLVLLALAVVAAVIGYATSWRKDVT
ncbi:MAG: transporter permease [Homoserinimonas sp.]|jgi:ABC-type transport system involved in multi-copper enzyme maturation permease subunit|nr:transporter permease [Homoserinimonas sp.]